MMRWRMIKITAVMALACACSVNKPIEVTMPFQIDAPSGSARAHFGFRAPKDRYCARILSHGGFPEGPMKVTMHYTINGEALTTEVMDVPYSQSRNNIFVKEFHLSGDNTRGSIDVELEAEKADELRWLLLVFQTNRYH